MHTNTTDQRHRDEMVSASWLEVIGRNPGLYRPAISYHEMRRFAGSPYIAIPMARTGSIDRPLVLEPGCASGKFSAAFALRGCNVVALDYSDRMLHNARTLYRGLSTSGHLSPVWFTQGDICAMCFGDDLFDVVINEGVVEHWIGRTERISVIREMVRVAKPGGCVCVIVPNGGHPWHVKWSESGYYTGSPPMVNYHPQLLEDDFQQAGLTNISIDGIAPFLSLGHPTGKGPLTFVGRVLNKLVKPRLSMRRKWGINLIALGVKA